MLSLFGNWKELSGGSTHYKKMAFSLSLLLKTVERISLSNTHTTEIETVWSDVLPNFEDVFYGV